MNKLRKKLKIVWRKFSNVYLILMGTAVILFVRGVIGLFLIYFNDFKLKELE